MAATVAELDIIFNADASGAQSAFALVQDTLFRTAIAGSKIGDFIMGGVGTAVSSAIDLETEMNNVNSIAKVNQAQLGAWTEEVQGLAVEWGQSSVDTAQGMYQIQSAGFDAADAIDILASSSQAARAGLTTVEVASDAVTSVLKAYELQLGSTSDAYQALNTQGERAEYVQNVLFRGVDRGKMTYEQLAGAIGNTIASAATAGVSIEEVVGGMALMTQQGLSASEAGTAMNNTLLGFISPSEDMTAAVQSMGYESALTMLQTEGLAGSMQLLETYTGGSADEIAKLFTNIRSRRGAMLLMNGDLEGMVDAMDDAQSSGDKLGAMQSALAEQTKSTSFAIDVMHASFEVMGQELVQSFLPVIRVLAMGLAELAQFIIGLPTPVKDFLGTVTLLAGAFFTAAGAVAIFFALFGPILPLLGLLTAAIIGVSVPLAALFALFSAFGFRDVVQGFSDMVDALDVPFLDHFTNSVERAAEAYHRFTGLFQTETGFVQIDGYARSIGALGAALIAFAESTSGLDFADGPIGRLGDFLKDLAVGIDLFNKAYDKYRGKEEYDTQDDYGVPDIYDDGAITYKKSKIDALKLAWVDFSDYANKEWPKQTELIGQFDKAVMGMLDGVELAMGGEWDAAWDRFSDGIDGGTAAIRTIGGNIANAVGGIDWGAVYDALGTALDGAFDGIIQGVEWVANVAAPAVFGWLYENSGAIWEGIKGIGGWVFDRFSETVNWIIDIAVPAVIGDGKSILENVRVWLAGKLSGGTAGGWASGSVSGAGNGASIDLGSVFVDWAIDVAMPKMLGAGYSIWNNIKGWLAGKMQGGSAGGWASGSVSGAGASGGNIDIGTLTASWDINVLEPTLAGWISGAAGWLQGKLQNYVNGVTGGSSMNSEGIGGSRGAVGSAGGGLVQLAGWAIDVLEPAVNLSQADVHGAIQRMVQAAGALGSYTVTGIHLIIGQITGEDVSSSSDIPGAIQVFVDNTKKEYAKLVQIRLDFSLFIGGISTGGQGSGPSTGGYSEGIGGTRGGNGSSSGVIQQFFESELFGAGGAEFYQTVKTFMNYEVTNLPSDALTKLQAFKDFISKPLDLHIPISLSFDFLGDKLPDLPDWVTDFADALRPLAKFDPTGSANAFVAMVDGWNNVTTAADEARAAQEAAVGATAGEFDTSQYRPSNSLTGYGHQPSPSVSMLNIERDKQAPNMAADFAQPTAGDISPMQGQTFQPPDMVGPTDNAVQGYKTALTQLVPVTQQATEAIAPAFDTSFRGFGANIATQTGNATRDFGTGLSPMPNVASTTATGATDSMSGGLLGMAGAAGAQAVGTAGAMAGGIAPMPGQAGQTAGNTHSSMRNGLAPLPGTVGGIATSTGNSFMVGITSGFVQAAIAAQVGASAIRAAANSIGDLYGVGYAVGSSLGAGVAAGILSQVGAVASAASALVNAANGSARNTGIINSPSKLMFDQVGVPLAQGITEGILSQSDEVKDAMGSIIEGRTGSYTLPKSKVVAINNNHYYVLEPESWMEVQRDSKMAATQLRDMNSRARQKVRSKPQVSRS